MNYPWLDNYLLSQKAVQKDFKAEWGWDRYMIDGKLFRAVCYDENSKAKFITLKLKPEEGQFMRNRYADVIPGYYMNKLHWNSVVADGNLPDEVLKELLDKSYNLVLSSLTKKRQKEINEMQKGYL